MRSISRIALATLCTWAVSLPAAAADLKLEIRDGKVTLVAHDVPARQILNEWARLGQMQVINADKLPSTLLTLELEGVPERKALDIVLRNASGHIAVPRMTALEGGSVYDRVIIMPPSTAVATNASAPRPLSSPMTPPPTFRPPGFPGGDADDQDPPVPMPGPNGLNGMPMSPLTPGMPGYVTPPNIAPAGVIPPYPGAPISLPGQQPQPQTQQPTPTNPWGLTTPGSATPGVISPMTPPMQPGAINPLVPRKPPGGGQ